MPSGYTDKIKDGIDFNRFILNCARAFGACSHQREDDSNIPPKKQKPSTYHLNKIKNLNKQLQKFRKFTKKQWDLLANKEYKEEINYCLRMSVEERDLKIKYDEMLDKVNKWNPPTKDHIELKTFMIEQIESSIKMDCNSEYYENRLTEEQKLTGKEYKNRKINTIKSDIKYHKKEHLKELKRTKDRNKWIDNLYKSLK